MSVIYREREILVGPLAEIAAAAGDGIRVSASSDATDGVSDTDNWKKTLDLLNVAPADRRIG